MLLVWGRQQGQLTVTPGAVALVKGDDEGLGPVRLRYPRIPITPTGFLSPGAKVLVLAITVGGNVIVLEGKSVVRLVGDSQLSCL